MYLNRQRDPSNLLPGTFNYNMGCIWIVLAFQASGETFVFNYNMGCIWIGDHGWYEKRYLRLTITWDVFEYATRKQALAEMQFNYNMGCIWIPSGTASPEAGSCLTITWDVFEWIRAIARSTPKRAFNYNMGCIWIVLPSAITSGRNPV